MIAVRLVSEYGDTRGLGLKPGDKYQCVDCGKVLKVQAEWPPPKGAKLPLYTWKLDSGTVVSVCKKDWEKRRGPTG
jgi:hypothetical protein